MYELVQAGDNTFYLESPAKVGLWRTAPDRVWLIDSGNDKEAGKRILRVLDGQGWKLEGILNTHSNADHVGGNQYLQQHTGCPAFARGLECAFMRHPRLEPSFLYGGYPCKSLRNKFLMAPVSDAMELSEETLPPGLRQLPLEGHFFDMAGFETEDGVFFLGDCLAGESILNKYHIFFIYDVQAFLRTLDFVEKLRGRCFIPAHGETAEDIGPMAGANRRKVMEIIDAILKICTVPRCFEDILKALCDRYALKLDFNQYVLVGSTVRSYLSYLCDAGRMAADFADNRLLWRAL